MFEGATDSLLAPLTGGNLVHSHRTLRRLLLTNAATIARGILNERK